MVAVSYHPSSSSVLRRADAFVLLEELAEERLVGEVQRFRYLLDVLVGVLQL